MVRADYRASMSNARLMRASWWAGWLLASLGVWAQQPAPGDRFRVSLLTVGPGKAIYEWFGHNTLVVEDRPSGKAFSFNYGVFSFDDPGFIRRFLEGRMMYLMEMRDLPSEIDYYRQAKRSLFMQELNLSPRQKERLVDFLLDGAKKENRRYLYNYYTANCSTKVRDAIDYALDGELRRQLESRATATTYREQTRAGSQHNFFLYTGLNFALGPSTDRPLNQWEDSFMPARLASYVRDVKLSDGRSLVGFEKPLGDVSVPPEPKAPDRVWLYLLIGAIWGGLVLWSAGTGRTRVTLIVVWLWLALSASGGVFLAWVFTTSHWAACWNQNVLLLPTTSLPMVAWWPVAMLRWNRWKWIAVGLLAAAGLISLTGLFLPFGLSMVLLAGLVLVPRRVAARGMAALLVVTLVTTVVAISLKFIPLLPQMNREILALAGPLNAVLVWAGWRSLVPAKDEIHESVQ
ncbi:MAG: DUF4105 domain-containing protein [Tepidisphaeraceae bacterium]|jgi:hypothetical protein